MGQKLPSQVSPFYVSLIPNIGHVLKSAERPEYANSSRTSDVSACPYIIRLNPTRSAVKMVARRRVTLIPEFLPCDSLRSRARHRLGS